MNLIKAKFLRYGEPSGREYTYISDIPVKVGDLVQLNERGQGIVTKINVSESEVESFRDRLKSIIGKVEVKKTEAADNESEAIADE